MLSLKDIRENAFLTQEELADKAGVCRDTVNQVERGRQTPEIRTKRKLAQALGVKPGEIAFSKN